MDDGLTPLEIRRSRRVRRMRMLVKPGRIEVVVPLTASQADVCTFIERHRAWAKQKLADWQAQLPVGGKRLAERGSIPFRGRNVPLAVTEHASRKPLVEFDDGFRISVSSEAGADQERLAQAALMAWIQNWLLGEIRRLIELHSPRHGLYPRSVRVKAMKTRWGSCGPKNDLNINRALAFAPPSALEYVLVHELCHIRHRDHSERFWRLVEQHLPGYQSERRWLRKQGVRLLYEFES